MSIGILLVAVVFLLCILAEKFSGRFGLPALIFFMFIGMLFGSDGLFKIEFNDYKQAEEICSIALLFIMFYGGFNTKWKLAKNVAAKSIALSTLGVVITALVTTVICRLALGLSYKESFMISAVLSSTDAASVFSILRKKKLNLKDGTASILELESGSNDPLSYLLTVVGISLMGAGKSTNIAVTIILQISLGILIGFIMACLTLFFLTKTALIAEGLDTIFMIAMILICYAGTQLLGGNPYLSIYIMGIIVGNSNIKNKISMIPFFDGVTSLAQILIFFLLGLLTFPHLMPHNISTALVIAVVLTLISRPIATFLLLLPWGCSVKQCLLIAWAGLRGASSSVFAITVVASGVTLSYDIFHIVFMVTLLSVSIQGTLLPLVSRQLDMVDDTIDVRKTFNDYKEESNMTLMRMYVPASHPWVGQEIRNVIMPTGSLALMIKRGHDTIIPRGDTIISAGDDIILSVPAYESEATEKLEEIHIDSRHPWCNRTIAELNLPTNEIIAMVIRGGHNIIPDGKTIIHAGDTVVEYHT
ncbi:MAG: potassium/proton antiporter [Wujia sp.]